MNRSYCSPLRVAISSLTVWATWLSAEFNKHWYAELFKTTMAGKKNKQLFFMLADVLGKSKIHATKIHIFPNCTQMEQHASTYFSAASAVCKVSAKFCFQQLTDVSIIHHFHKQTWHFFIWTSHVLEELRHLHDACVD